MYNLDHFPDPKHTFSIALEDNGKFWQLTDNNGGIIAESCSWRELKKYAKLKCLTITIYKNE